MSVRPLLALALIGATLASPVLAEDVGQHPAIFAPRSLPGVNPNTFIVGHPASPRTRAGHANSDHPAVALASAARTIDGNTFLVQPPATVTWTLGSASDTAVAGARSAAVGAQ